MPPVATITNPPPIKISVPITVGHCTVTRKIRPMAERYLLSAASSSFPNYDDTPPEIGTGSNSMPSLEPDPSRLSEDSEFDRFLRRIYIDSNLEEQQSK